jgi:hypothetical protein
MNEAEEISLLLGEIDGKKIEDKMRAMFPGPFHGRIDMDTLSSAPERKRKRSLSPPPHQGSNDTEELPVQKKKNLQRDQKKAHQQKPRAQKNRHLRREYNFIRTSKG